MKTRLLLALAVATVPACRCQPPTTLLKPEYVVTPGSLNFEACPTRDELDAGVADVFPDQKDVTVHNNAKTSGGLKATFTGAGAAVFSIDPKKIPGSVESLSDVVLPVQFSPVKKGVVKAQLVISDETDDTPDQTVDLSGIGSDSASQPTLVVAVLNAANVYEDCVVNKVCEQVFADTLFDESSSLELKLTNLGCPALKITGLEVIPFGGAAGTEAYFIEVPATPPSIDAPLVLTQSESRQSTKVKIKFAPTNDGSGNLPRFATLRIKTNDPNAKDSDNNVGGFDVQLSGSALQPAVYTTPTRCDYADGTDLCGNSPAKLVNQARFEVKNGGNVAIRIDETAFKSNNSETSSANGRFSIPTSIKNQVIAPGGFAVLQVNHTEMPLYVQDLLTVSVSVAGSDGGVGSAGKAILSIAGGKKPCLQTDPPIDTLSGQARLDFMSPMTMLSAKALTIKNGSDSKCGELIINGVSIEPNLFFTLIDPMIPPLSHLQPGMSLEATVQYKKPISGGTQVGTLRVDSNDGDFATPPGYVVQLYSQSPLDQLPVAVLKGCLNSDTTCAMGKQGTMSIQLSTLPMGPNGTRLMTMWGKDSFDPGNTGAMPISNYRFFLASKPVQAMTQALEFDNAKQPVSKATLSLDGTVTSGNYRVTLVVYDDKDQASGAPDALLISVNP